MLLIHRVQRTQCSAARHTQCNVVRSTKQCSTPHRVLIVQHNTHNAVWHNTHSEAVWRCMVAVPLRATHRQCGGELQEFHSPLPLGGMMLHFRSSTTTAPGCRNLAAHCPQVVRRCIVGVPLPTARRQRGRVL